MADTVIKIENVCKYYRNVMGERRFRALEAVSLEIKRGEIFGILGPNGSGKTTLLKLMLGLIFPTSGRIRILGESPLSVAYKARIGYLPEQPYFYDFLTPVELLDFYASLFGIGGYTKKKRIDYLIDKVGIASFKKMRIRNFSKGMLQRIGLAASLINDPEVLFLDEPTIGLDPIGTMEIQQLLHELNSEGKTIFLSSHLLAQVQDSCHRVAVIHRGRLIKVGELKEMLTSKDEISVVVKGMDRVDKEKLLSLIKQSGLEVVSMAEKTDSLKDLFVRIIREEMKD